MGSAVEADLQQLRLIFAIYERGDRAVSTAEIHREISDRPREELAYELAARPMTLYRAMLEGDAGVHVPQVRPALSTRPQTGRASWWRRVCQYGSSSVGAGPLQKKK